MTKEYDCMRCRDTRKVRVPDWPRSRKESTCGENRTVYKTVPCVLCQGGNTPPQHLPDQGCLPEPHPKPAEGCTCVGCEIALLTSRVQVLEDRNERQDDYDREQSEY